MKVSIFTTAALAITGAWAAAIKPRQASKSWAGTNNYFIQGLSSDQQDAYIGALKDAGIKVVRVWINHLTKGRCEKNSLLSVDVPALEDSIGQYNDQSLDAVHGVVQKLANNGIKAIISPHNSNSLTGDSLDIYGKVYGSGYFYEWKNASDAYDSRLQHILEYTSPVSQKAFKDWSDAVLAFDVQNEPMTAKRDECTNNDVNGWLCGRAQKLRSVLGDSSSIKVGTGGIGGDYIGGCNFMSAALECDAVDLISVHRYPGNEGGTNPQWSGNIGNWLSSANGKLVYIEEWGIDSTKVDQSSEIPKQVDDINTGAIPWMYWQVLPTQTCTVEGENENFGFYVGGSVDLNDIVSKTAQTDAKQDWTGLINF